MVRRSDVANGLGARIGIDSHGLTPEVLCLARAERETSGGFCRERGSHAVGVICRWRGRREPTDRKAVMPEVERGSSSTKLNTENPAEQLVAQPDQL